MNTLREDAFSMIQESINAVMPEVAVEEALRSKIDTWKDRTGNLVVIAIGKAAWNMAATAKEILGSLITDGLVVTKYEHAKGEIDGFEIIEAGHPIPDENSVKGAMRAIELVKDLNEDDQVVLLISGGGSAVFEKPVEGVTIQDLTIITDQLLSCGADIVEINTIRKHLSDVKAGRFAMHCKNTPIYSVVLSDVVGDRLDSIASGPAYPDETTSEMALDLVEKYSIFVGAHVREALTVETPKELSNVETVITGNVKRLCESAAKSAQQLGYKPVILTTTLDCEAKEAGRFMASIAKELKSDNAFSAYPKAPCAIIVGGETVVHVTGKGAGGRSQELVLAAAIGIENLEDVTIFAVGSDGTDGPTDAAGGIVDGESAIMMRESGVDPDQYLRNNDAYRALNGSGDLIVTGPTGTNVNDLMVILCR